MSIERRTGDRRRRVLYTTHHTDPTSGGELERMREARRPAAVYGSRVHRRLRARWFSLVPVRRSTMMLTVGVITAIAGLLCLGHYASVGWSSVAYRPEIARPLRLDRPDSFGRWFMIAMLTGSAGASFLIYQLRRHRNDDFAGRYRLWRVAMTVALLASLQVLVSIIDWGGALLDLAFGQRVALTGSDWIRLVVMFGGAILALQVITEIRRCRVAAVSYSIAIGCWAITEAATWNVLEVNTLNRWVLVTAAPLLASTAVFITALSYLRMLYREVRQIEDSVSMRERWQLVRQNLFDKDPEEEETAAESKPAKKETQRRRQRERTERKKTDRNPKPLKVRTPQPTTTADEDLEESSEESEEKKPSKRGWFGRKKKVRDESDAVAEPDTKPDSPKKQKKRRFSLRLAPPTTQDVGQTETPAEEPAAEPKKKRRGWLKRKPAEQEEEASDNTSTDEVPKEKKRGWLRRDKSATADQDNETSSDQKQEKNRRRWLGRKKVDDSQSASDSDSNPKTTVRTQESSTATSESEEPIDPNEIDWNSMSKSERRRLRKQLKRQNRAA